jgi:hypothetical protein
MNAIYSIHLRIPGSFDVKYVYVCQQHAEEYERDYHNWITRKRPVSSLRVACNRCDDMRRAKEVRDGCEA